MDCAASPRTPLMYLTTLPRLPSRLGRATPLVFPLDVYDVDVRSLQLYAPVW